LLLSLSSSLSLLFSPTPSLKTPLRRIGNLTSSFLSPFFSPAHRDGYLRSVPLIALPPASPDVAKNIFSYCFSTCVFFPGNGLCTLFPPKKSSYVTHVVFVFFQRCLTAPLPPPPKILDPRSGKQRRLLPFLYSPLAFSPLSLRRPLKKHFRVGGVHGQRFPIFSTSQTRSQG